MKKAWLVIGGIGLVIIAAILYVLFANNKVSSPQDSNRTSQASDSPTTPEQSSPQDAPAPQPGAYKDYSKEALAKATGRKVIFFHAAWCPQCRQLDRSIKEGSIPPNVTIFKTDYDTHLDLRQKYGVTLQTTLVEVGVNGDAVGKYVAYDTPTLDAVVKGLKL